MISKNTRYGQNERNKYGSSIYTLYHTTKNRRETRRGQFENQKLLLGRVGLSGDLTKGLGSLMRRLAIEQKKKQAVRPIAVLARLISDLNHTIKATVIIANSHINRPTRNFERDFISLSPQKVCFLM